jgi:N-acyl homoserine lactone hydrolase
MEMAELTVWPVMMSKGAMVDKSTLTHGMNQGVMTEIACVYYVIKGGAETVVVDTGLGDPEWSKKYHARKPVSPAAPRPQYQDLPTGLKKLGLHPDDIPIVICTHLHWDHCFNNDLFKKAKIVVQREEMRYAIAPLPEHALFYESQLIKMRPPWLKAIENIEMIEGDMEIIPGIDVVTVPGHTPGSQGVNVKTAKGNYFIASDFCPLFENWEGSPPLLKHIASPIHVNLEDYYRSFKKVEAFADFVLPGHDVKVLERECYP